MPQSTESATHQVNVKANQPIPVDIAIVGGAMAGATLALGLLNAAKRFPRPIHIAVIEAQTVTNKHPGFDARSIAIAHGSVESLKTLGLWQSLAHLGTPISDIHISDRGHFGMTELNSQQFNVSAMGQVVELERVGQVLFEQLQQASETDAAHTQAKLSLFCPAKLEQISASTEAQHLTLDTGERIDAKLVVAADGLNSKVRQAYGLPLAQQHFAQQGIIANIVTDKPHEHWAWERFTETGPLALLPMSDTQGQSRLSLVWALDDEQAEQLQAAPKAEFLTRLQAAFGTRAGRFIDVGERHRYPLSLSYMQRPIYHRSVFVGNAAQTLHPIAGQGFNLGLRDVVSLIDVIEQTMQTHGDKSDLGSVAVTHGYMNARQQDRTDTIRNIESLVRGFSNQHWPLVAGRNIGLRLLSWFPMFKHPVAAKAMGWRAK